MSSEKSDGLKMKEPFKIRECPNHKEPHGVQNKPENLFRLWACQECPHIFGDEEIRKDIESDKWGHVCKMKNFRTENRCESHLIPYVPEDL